MASFITGGAGFLGQHLAERLAASGEEVVISDIKESHLKKKSHLYLDVTNLPALKKATKNVNTIFNLASLLPCSRAGNMFWEVNVDGTKNVLDAALENGVKKVVHVSSSIVYGIPAEIPCKETSPTNPIGDYGKSKLAAEKLCLDYMEKGLDITILRPRLLMGAGRLGLLYILFDWIQKNKNIYVIGNGQNKFQMIGITDFVDACALSVKRGANEIINLGADNVPLISDLLSELIVHANSKSKLVKTNAAFARAILMALDQFHLTPLGTEHYMIADKDYILDTSKAKKILGWSPKQTQFEAMCEAYDWFVKNSQSLQISSGSADKPNLGLLRLIKLFS